MAVVKGVKEKVHLPLYDAITFEKHKKSGPESKKTEYVGIAEVIAGSGNIIKFFVNIQNKTKLETNQQEAGVLSHYNTYEARAMRVVIEPPPNGDEKSKDNAFLSNFIYNSVTSFVVGEKVMIQAPTWFFPSGAGPTNEDGLTNGNPTPEATFRFAEPIHISHQQNFRVEIEFPRGTENLGNSPGPAKIWVVVDGYLTRDVQ